MRWSKIKTRVRERLAPSVSHRVDFHSTWYRSTGQYAGRAWMTIDGVEIENFSDSDWWRRFYPLANRIRELASSDAASGEADLDAWEKAESILHKGHLYRRHDFYAALYEYLDFSIDDALSSPDPLIRALAMLDRRLGRRRLSEIQIDESEHPLVYALLSLRLEAEGTPKKVQPDPSRS